MKFMRKYIAVAKDLKPTLTREAADYMSDEYAKLRNQDNLSADNVAKVYTCAPVHILTCSKGLVGCYIDRNTPIIVLLKQIILDLHN